MATKYVTCPNCHSQNPSMNARCMTCGAGLPSGPMQPFPQQPGMQPPGADKKIAAGICGILLGGFGVHKFILGYQQEGLILLGVTLAAWVIAFVTCGIGVPLVFVPGIVGI